MPKLYTVKPKEAIRFVKSLGYELDHIRGSHYVFKHTATNKIIVIPYHNRDMRIGTVKSIIRTLEVDQKYFLDNI